MKKEKRLKNKLLYLVVGLILFIIGIFFNRCIDVPYFCIDKNINILTLLSIMVTIAVGLYVNLVINKNNERNNQLKKICIEKISEIDMIIKEIVDLLEKGNVDFYLIVSKITLVNKLLYLIYIHKIINKTKYDELQEKMEDLNNECTSSKIGIKILNNQIEINNTEKNIVVRKAFDIRNIFFEINLNIISDLNITLE